MGKGYDYVRKVALEAAKAQMQKLVAQNAANPGDCQVGQLSAIPGNTTDGNTVQNMIANFPDGTSATVAVQGLPGDYVIVCAGIAVVPEPRQVQLDGLINNALILGFDSITNDLYVRKLGSALKYVIPKSLDGGAFAFDSRIDPTQFQGRFASDGKALMIGGFFQDIPTEIAPPGQGIIPFNPPVDGSNNGAYQVAYEGYSYHTFAQYAVFTDFSLSTDSNNVTSFNYGDSFGGYLDLTEETENKIAAPTQQGLGSAAVYRLYPSQADLYTPTQNTADGTAQFTEARFFPAVNQSFTTSGDPFTFLDSIEVEETYFNIATSGDLQTVWSNDGQTYPLFMGKGQLWGCTPSNLLYAFNVDATGTYTLDIVSDITYATLYKIDSQRMQTYSTFSFSIAARPDFGEDGEFADCYNNQLISQSYSNIYSPYYAYIQPFHNITFDRYIVNGNINPIGAEQIVISQGGTGTFLSDPNNPGKFLTVSGGLTAVETDFGPICAGGSECVYFVLTSVGPDGKGICGGPGETESCILCGYVTDNNFQVTDYDGTFFSIDDFGPLFESGGYGSFFIFNRDGGCNPPACSGANGFMSVMDSFFFNDSIEGSFDGYRFGRGIASFNSALTISPDPDNPGTFQIVDNYIGPSIAVSRLTSPLSQNHLYEVFRSTTNTTACVYQLADPYVLPMPQSQPSYQDLIDELNNPLAFDGVDVIDQNIIPPSAGGNNGSGGFDMFFWSSPYVTLAGGITVNQSNYVQPPDVFTDTILSPHGTWPFADQLLKGADSYVVQGYSFVQDEDGNIEETIVSYNIAPNGLTTKSTSAIASLKVTGEFVEDWILPLKVGNNA